MTQWALDVSVLVEPSGKVILPGSLCTLLMVVLIRRAQFVLNRVLVRLSATLSACFVLISVLATLLIRWALLLAV